MQPIFLTAADVLQIHAHQIQMYGGDVALRDLGLLQSAVAMPQAMFGGHYLHEFPAGMAAAYLFHIAKNHAFVDGNKRAALASSLVFLKLNGFELDAQDKQIEETVLAVACGHMSKDELGLWLSRHIKSTT